MSKYKVLWIDDQPSEEFVNEAAEYDIDIELAICHYDGIKLLADKTKQWDAIILDANCKINQDDSPNLASLTESILHITTLCGMGQFIPWFVYTAGGYEGFSYLNNMISKKRDWDDREYYSKPSQRYELFDNLKKAADNRFCTHIKHQYNKVFEAFSDEIKGHDMVLNILLALHGHNHLEHQTYYTQLRLILEWMFRDANKRGLLHDKCIDERGKVNLTESSLFMAGRPTKYHGVRCDIAHFPKIIADNVKNLLEITGGASHTAEPDKKELVNLQAYWEQVNTPYLLYSLTFMLCDILIWYKEYADTNNDYVANVTLWKSIEPVQPLEKNIVSGVITNFDPAGRAFLQPDGATQRKENCSIDPKKFIGVDIKVDNRFTVEFEEKEIVGKDPMRIVVRIISPIN